MTPKDELLLEFHSDPRFKQLEQEILDSRPSPPIFAHQGDAEKQVEKWKALSNQQIGFDIVLSILKIGVKNE